MKRVGIMGGTFNPIHNAHLAMAQAAYEQYHLDEVWFMPSKNPPHKEENSIVSQEHRKRMVQFAIDEIPHFVFSDFEYKREGKTYTCETLEKLQKKYKDTEFYFIIGGDSLFAFHTWYHPERIVKQCILLAAPREDTSYARWCEICKEKASEFHGDIRPLSFDFMDISSEMIRKKRNHGESIVGMCKDKVQCYMDLHQLYMDKPNNNTTMAYSLFTCLSSTLRPKRYEHTLGVAYTAASLAMIHGEKALQEQAFLAGLLHDCAKYFTGQEQLALCEKYKIPLTDAERKNTALIHGKLGAYLAEKRYGITDTQIQSAISFHTTGKPNMTKLEKIIYIADYIEPKRVMETSPYSLDEIRKTCFQNLDEGLYKILRCTITYLEQSGKEMDSRTQDTFEFYKEKGEFHE